MRLINKPLLASVLTVLAVMCVSAQDSRPRFEVASVKPNSSSSPASAAFINGRFVATNTPLKVILGLAYRSSSGRPFYQIIGGPPWIASAGYDVDAKTADSRPIPVEQAILMLQSLLEECFQLKVHSKTRELPVYHLVVAKGGVKLKLSEDQTPLPVDGTTEPRTLNPSGEPPRGSYRIMREPAGSPKSRG